MLEQIVCLILCAKVQITTIHETKTPTIPQEDRRLPERQKGKVYQARTTSNIQGVQEIRNTIRNLWGEKADEAEAIIKCESNWNPQATGYNKNGSIDRGLFQLNSVHLSKIKDPDPVSRIYQVDTNISLAHSIYVSHGNSWNAWVCARKLGFS